jgi:hypothetical protein
MPSIDVATHLLHDRALARMKAPLVNVAYRLGGVVEFQSGQFSVEQLKTHHQLHDGRTAGLVLQLLRPIRL